MLLIAQIVSEYLLTNIQSNHWIRTGKTPQGNSKSRPQNTQKTAEHFKRFSEEN